MIKSFKHKGLERFFTSGTLSGIQTSHAKKLRIILGRLNASRCPEDMDLPGLQFHKLKGSRSDIWAVHVNANWRITFRFIGLHAEIVNYEDYH